LGDRTDRLQLVLPQAAQLFFAESLFVQESPEHVRQLRVAFTVQKALPLLQPGGSIVLNASMVSSTGSPAFSVYSATKAAVRSFARTWSVDLKERKVRVNAISPGIVPTPGYNTSLGMTQQQVDQLVQSSIGNIPLGRPGTADEIAKAVLFLASDDASYVTGIELFVDGGLAQV
jgi:NAD(P)-dependent dehydrogenase (short-subunit alcohol dehydrogenase family)